MGWQVPRPLVSAGDALPHRAHEEDRPVTARASRTDPQLFPRSEAALQRGCRGPEQQSQTHHEKILRIPHLPLSRTCPLSLTWQITGAGINPRVFLTNQFYKEHGVAGLERVYETAHVYRAEPHASSRHLTEYYSLDVEFGFIDGPEDVIQLERELLTDMFENLNRKYGSVIEKYRADPLPSMLGVACWEFEACLEMLRAEFGRTDLEDDL